MDWKVLFEQGAAMDPRVGRFTQRLGRPAWPLRLGVLCGFAVVVLPLLALLLFGLLFGGLVYVVASVIQRIGDTVTGGGPDVDGSAGGGSIGGGDDVRENVRVIQR
jgi:hypothetical protein